MTKRDNNDKSCGARQGGKSLLHIQPIVLHHSVVIKYITSQNVESCGILGRANYHLVLWSPRRLLGFGTPNFLIFDADQAKQYR